MNEPRLEKVTIQHTCGHEGVHGITGSQRDRQMRVQWLQRQPCQECWRTRQYQQAQTNAATLVPLTGTDEEIAWAEVIRTKTIAHNREFYDQLRGEVPYADDPELNLLVNETADAAMAALENESRATFWIEHRFDMLAYVKQRIVAAIRPVLESRSE